MPSPNNVILRASQLLPQPNPDSQPQEARSDNYGGAVVHPMGGMRHFLAKEGSYMAACTPTPGTAVAYGSAGTQTSYSATTAFAVFKNNAANSGIPMLMALDYLRIIMAGTAPATVTSVEAAVHIDTGNRAPTSNNSQLTANNLNFRSQRGVSGQLWVPNAGVPAVPAAVSARQVSRLCLLPAIPVTRSEFCVRFGQVEASGPTGVQTVGKYDNFAGPVVLGPQEFCVFTLWLPGGATNPFSCEIEAGWWER